MPLAYTFWHQPRRDVAVREYERDLGRFHERLAAVPIPGFVSSHSLRVPDLPWLPGGGYEDWYLIDDFTALGVLNQAAIDAARLTSHDALADAVHDGRAGVYAALKVAAEELAGWVGWFSKRDGVRYPELRAELQEHLDKGAVRAVWQRQMTLGPTPEFRLEAAGPVQLAGADLVVAVSTAGSTAGSTTGSTTGSTAGSTAGSG
jgi:hypothetical protein